MSGWAPQFVPRQEWRAAVLTSVQEGFTYFDWLGCVDEVGRSDSFRVVIALRHGQRLTELRSLATSVPRESPYLDSLREVFPGAGWHEREAAELFGVQFVGGDRRHLLLNEDFEGAPLRKDEVLAARTAVTWPGAKDPGESTPVGQGSGTEGLGGRAGSPGRRRMVPPGVPEPEVWGDRDPEAPAPTAAEVAGSAGSARVRRPRR
jgi:NADH-quinone oxidoreductase subunit C